MIYIAKVKKVLQSNIHKIGTIENGELKIVSSMPQADRVEIELEGSEIDPCTMNRFTKDNEFCGDTWHENFADALSQAAFEYGLKREDFKTLAATEFDKLGKKEKFNDQFRMPGSKYEYDEPIAFLTISKGEEIDWAHFDFNYIYDFLYIPGIIFEEIVKKAQELDLTYFKKFKLYQDERFSGDILLELLSEIDKIRKSIEDQDVLKAIELIIEKIEKCISSTELELAFEGY